MQLDYSPRLNGVLPEGRGGERKGDYAFDAGAFLLSFSWQARSIPGLAPRIPSCFSWVL